MPDTVLEDIEVNPDDVFENQNNILKKIANLKENILEKHQGEIRKDFENAKINGASYEKIETEKNAIIKYEFEIEQEKNAYFHIPYSTNLENAHIYINEEKISDKYISNTNRMLLLGKHEKGEKIRIIIEQEKNDFFINGELVYYENDEILDKYYEILSKEQVDLRQISGRKYEGTIKVQSDNKYVLFTIPYDEGWKVKVDGKRQDAIKMQDIFIGINIEDRGEHKIELEFTPKGLISRINIKFYAEL